MLLFIHYLFISIAYVVYKKEIYELLPLSLSTLYPSKQKHWCTLNDFNEFYMQSVAPSL